MYDAKCGRRQEGGGWSNADRGREWKLRGSFADDLFGRSLKGIQGRRVCMSNFLELLAEFHKYEFSFRLALVQKI